MNLLMRTISYIKHLPKQYSIGGALVLAILVAVGGHFILTRTSAVESAPPDISHVRISSVAGLSSQTGPLPVTGKVSSLSQATILAQSSGEIVSLSHELGDRVAAGDVIATFENSAQRAAVLQAQGAYDAAQAMLAKTSGSGATNATLTSSQAASAAANAAASARTALSSAYASLDDAVHTKADTLFENPKSTSPMLLPFTIPDSQLVVSVKNKRADLESVLNDSRALASATGNADISANIDKMTADTQLVADFLNDLIRAINQAVPNQRMTAADIASAQAVLAASRASVVGTLASLTATKGAYESARTGAATAANAATGGTDNDIAAAQANVKQALGALNAAQSNLSKTVIRSPISGTIVTLTITRGDYVSAFSQVAAVSNPGALQINTYVTPDDAKTLAVGGGALIDGTTRGVITSIAPAIDPTTGKIEVKVGITGDQTALTDGDTVTVSLTRSTADAKKTSVSAQTMTIPIVATKITPNGPVVFTLSASSTLAAVPIKLGTILGDRVTVIEGLSADMTIVSDARGLSNGQSVIVETQ